MTHPTYVLNPQISALAGCGAANPANPFFTAAYANARRSLGDRIGLIQLRRGHDGTVVSVPFFLSPLRLGTSLEVPSLPADLDPASVVAALTQVVRQFQVACISLPGFASPSGCVTPLLPWPTTHYSRTEFVIDLTVPDLYATMSRSHRQRARQGHRSGLLLARSRDAAACADHARLMASSMSRRRDRGEEAAEVSAALLQPFLESSAGELFQAVRDGVVYSSMLLLRATSGVYDQSSGTSGQGMSMGAAQFLIAAAGEALAAEGIETLNLGGVRGHETGLRAFKTHFGARENTIVAAVVDSRSWAWRLGASIWHRLRRGHQSHHSTIHPPTSIATAQDEPIDAVR